MGPLVQLRLLACIATQGKQAKRGGSEAGTGVQPFTSGTIGRAEGLGILARCFVKICLLVVASGLGSPRSLPSPSSSLNT